MHKDNSSEVCGRSESTDDLSLILNKVCDVRCADDLSLSLNKVCDVRFADDLSFTLNKVCDVRSADDLPNPNLYAQR